MDPRNRALLAEGLAKNQHDAVRELVKTGLYGATEMRPELDLPWEKLPLKLRELMIAVTAMTVIDELKLTPCHVTGMHTPEHHAGKEKGGEVTEGYTCDIQANEALTRFIKSVGGENRNDLPRELHPEGTCGWCHDPTYGGARWQRQLRRTWAWAGRKLRIPRDKLRYRD